MATLPTVDSSPTPSSTEPQTQQRKERAPPLAGRRRRASAEASGHASECFLLHQTAAPREKSHHGVRDSGQRRKSAAQRGSRDLEPTLRFHRPSGFGTAMEEQFILRVPPSVAERIERLMNESAASSSNPDEASLDLSFSEDGRNGTFMIGNESFPASLLDLPAVVESYKTYDDSVLIKTADIGQMIMVREENDPAPEGVEYKHGLTPPMRDARRRRFRREPDLNAELVNQVEKHLINIMHGVSVNQNASVIGGEEGGDRKKPPVARAAKQPGVQEPAANGEEAEPERSDTDESEN